MSPRNATTTAAGRTYTFDGKTVPSVTSILSAYPKSALMGWYAKMTAAEALRYLDGSTATKQARQAILDDQWLAHEATKTHETRHKNICDFTPDPAAWLAGAPVRYRDAAGARGTAVHEAAELGADLADVPERAQKRYEQYLRWVDDWQPQIIAQEFQVFNDAEGFAGSGDLIADILLPPWDRLYRTLLDIKTSSSLHHEMRLQLAAYRNGRKCIDGDLFDFDATAALRSIERTAILHLTDEGYALVEVEAGEAEFATFLDVKRVYEFSQANDRSDVGTVIVPAPMTGAA